MNANPILPATLYVPVQSQSNSQESAGNARSNQDLSSLDFAGIQKIIGDLQKRGDDGFPLLEQLASELSVVVGTEVKPQINSNNQFCLVWAIA